MDVNNVIVRNIKNIVITLGNIRNTISNKVAARNINEIIFTLNSISSTISQANPITGAKQISSAEPISSAKLNTKKSRFYNIRKVPKHEDVEEAYRDTWVYYDNRNAPAESIFMVNPSSSQESSTNDISNQPSSSQESSTNDISNQPQVKIEKKGRFTIKRTKGGKKTCKRRRTRRKK